MRSVQLRPTFAVPLPAAADEAIMRLRATLLRRAARQTISTGNCIELFVDPRDRRIWSPHLSLQIEPSHDGSVLHGRFSPRADVWTLLMFLYFTILTLVFFGAVLGFAQGLIGQPAWGWLAVPVGLPLIGALHVSSLIGQRLSHTQMQELRERLDAALEEEFEILPEEA